MKPTLTCPACGHVSLPGPDYGSYDGCVICKWEDDPFQLIDPFSRSGPQCVSLSEYQSRFGPPGEAAGFSKDPDWHPLSQASIDRAEIESAVLEYDPFKPIVPYWKKKK